MVHTCSQELCVRPQHIRFRASSVALVIVLKALAQAGYSIVPPLASPHPTPRTCSQRELSILAWQETAPPPPPMPILIILPSSYSYSCFFFF